MNDMDNRSSLPQYAFFKDLIGQTLALDLEITPDGNSLIRDLEGEWVLRRRAPGADRDVARHAARRYALLGPADVYLGYAGRFHPGAEIHAQLARLTVGDALRPAGGLRNRESV